MYLTLGYDCSPAAAIRTLGLRPYALPFDWIVSSITSLTRCLEEDFLQFHTNLKFNHDSSRLIAAYGFEFPHDYPLEDTPEHHDRIGEGIIGEGSGKRISDRWPEHYDLVMEKYRRRIDRFRLILHSTPIIVLCRYPTPIAIQLRDLLLRFAITDQIRVINSNSESFYTEWMININTERDGKWNDHEIWKEAITLDDIKTFKK